MSIALEHIAPNDWFAVQRLAERLSRLVIDTGNLSLGVRVGTGTITFPGGTTISHAATVVHGLGRTPVFVGAFETQDHGTADLLAFNTATYTSTTALVRGGFIAGTVPALGATENFTWIAIG